MKHIYCFSIILVVALFPARAQTEGAEIFSRPLDGNTRSRFDGICADLAKNPVIKGGFEQTKIISRLNRSLVSRGDFIIAAELGMVWDTKTPFPSTMTVGRDYIFQSTPSGAKTRLDARGNETFLRLADTISAIFTGNSRLLLENFAVYFAESGNSWTIGLIPEEKSVKLFASRILMSGESGGGGIQTALIRDITLYEQNGDVISYRLSNHSYPGNLSARERTFFAPQ
ncbi:MAG: outer membrane lipoprotein carrier protein LolA [Treponema sp.]|jgi:hypothetical protein|nr:outer membrane lipoprotein carrier protein LolA [Treponema sp.]